jgi:hypothetical protein
MSSSSKKKFQAMQCSTNLLLEYVANEALIHNQSNKECLLLGTGSPAYPNAHQFYSIETKGRSSTLPLSSATST